MSKKVAKIARPKVKAKATVVKAKGAKTKTGKTVHEAFMKAISGNPRFRPAKPSGKAFVIGGAKPLQPAKVIRPGTKLAIIAGLLMRKQGVTAKEALAATGWPAISFPQQAEAAGLKLRKEREGRITRYWGEAG